MAPVCISRQALRHVLVSRLLVVCGFVEQPAPAGKCRDALRSAPSVWTDNPQGVFAQHHEGMVEVHVGGWIGKEKVENAVNGLYRLVPEPQHYDTESSRPAKMAHLSEVEIKCDNHTSLFVRQFGNPLIGGSSLRRGCERQDVRSMC